MTKFNTKNILSEITFLLIANAVILVHYLMPRGLPVGIAEILYLLIFTVGTWLLRQSLLLLFSDLVTALTLVMITAGTNIFYIAAFDMQYQAILSFSLYAALLGLTIAWYTNGKRYLLLLSAGVIALLILVHPTGYLSLFIPLLWMTYGTEAWKKKMAFLYSKKWDLLLFLIILLIILVPAIFILKIAPGEIPFLDIKLPGLFIFGSSYIWDDLLSFDHGLLIYTPSIILPLIGFYFLAEKKPIVFFPVFIFCLIDLLLESCWSHLSETDVFGQIAFAPMMAVLSIPFASFMEKTISMKWWWRTLLLLVSLIIVLQSIFQSFQYMPTKVAQPKMNIECQKTT